MITIKVNKDIWELLYWFLSVVTCLFLMYPLMETAMMHTLLYEIGEDGFYETQMRYMAFSLVIGVLGTFLWFRLFDEIASWRVRRKAKGKVRKSDIEKVKTLVRRYIAGIGLFLLVLILLEYFGLAYYYYKGVGNIVWITTQKTIVWLVISLIITSGFGTLMGRRRRSRVGKTAVVKH